MNFAANLATLARNSVLDPEPSYWARQVITDMEIKFFAGQDDYEPWTPAFSRRLAQFLDVKARGERVNAPAANRNDDPAQEAVRGVMAAE
jgi:hypothetical protein